MPVVSGLTHEEAAALDHRSHGPMLLTAHWALMSFATLFLAARIYVKFSFKKGIWWDDWFLLASWVVCVVTCILTTILVKEYTLGNHSYDIVIPDMEKFLIILDSRATTTLTAMAWTKTAFAVTLLRLTTGKTKAFVWFIIITLNIAMAISAMVPWIQCQPMAKRWHSELDGKCWGPGVGVNVWVGTGALSAFYDFVLAFLPWTFLYTLMLRKKEKVGILVAMSMGAVAGAVAIVKCVKLPSLGTQDNYDEVHLFVWDIAESTVTIIAACIPALRVFLRDKASTGPSNERSTRFSQFSFSFRTANRGRRMFGSQDVEVVSEQTGEKGEVLTESGASRDGSAAGSGSGSGSGSGGTTSGSGSGKEKGL